MIAWAAGGRTTSTLETQFLQVETIDEGVDHANRVVLVNPVLEPVRRSIRLNIPTSAFGALSDTAPNSKMRPYATCEPEKAGRCSPLTLPLLVCDFVP